MFFWTFAFTSCITSLTIDASNVAISFSRDGVVDSAFFDDEDEDADEDADADDDERGVDLESSATYFFILGAEEKKFLAFWNIDGGLSRYSFSFFRQSLSVARKS